MLGHHDFYIVKAQGEAEVQPNAVDDDCRWIAVAIVGDGLV